LEVIRLQMALETGTENKGRVSQEKRPLIHSLIPLRGL